MNLAIRGWWFVGSMSLAALPMSAVAETDVIFIDGFEPIPGFQIQLPQIMVPPGGSGTYSYYVRAPIAGPMAVKRWSSTITAATHHVIAYATYDSAWMPLEMHPTGTLLESSCLESIGSGQVGWLYAAHHPTQDLVLPNDDGVGKPLAMEIQAAQPLCLEIYIPSSDTTLTASALLRADSLPTGQPYTKSAAYLTYNFSLTIPPSTTVTVQQTCPTPAGAKFWRVSTRTHRFATFSRILDGTSVLLENPDWEDPAGATFTAPAFHPFASGGLKYECTYFNFSGNTVHAGEQEDLDEVCMGIGYFFPAEHPAFCLNSSGPL